MIIRHILSFVIVIWRQCFLLSHLNWGCKLVSKMYLLGTQLTPVFRLVTQRKWFLCQNISLIDNRWCQKHPNSGIKNWLLCYPFFFYKIVVRHNHHSEKVHESCPLLSNKTLCINWGASARLILEDSESYQSTCYWSRVFTEWVDFYKCFLILSFESFRVC